MACQLNEAQRATKSAAGSAWCLGVAVVVLLVAVSTEAAFPGWDPRCSDPLEAARHLLGIGPGETLHGPFVLSEVSILAQHCGTSVFRVQEETRGKRLDVLAWRTEQASSCACRTRNYCLIFRDTETGRTLAPTEVPKDLLRAVCVRAGLNDRGVMIDHGPRNAAYRWILVALGLVVLCATLWALTREVFAPDTPRYVPPILGAIVVVAGALRMFVSEHGFLHEYFHFGTTIENYLFGDLLDSHGEVGPAFYRLAWLVSGDEEKSVFGTNAVLATLTVACLALLDYRLFRSWPRALFSALILAFLPHHLRVSGSEDLFVPMVLFAVSALAWGAHYFRSGSRMALALSAAAMFLAAQSRPEGILTVGFLGLLALAGFRLGWHRALMRPATWVALGAFIGAMVMQRALVPSMAEGLVRDVDLLHPPWPQLWLDPDVTPVFLPVLCIVALWVATQSRDPLPGWLLLAAEVTVYSGLVFFHGSPTYMLRAQTAAIPYFVLLAAGGGEFLLRLAYGHRIAARTIAALLALVVAGGAAERVAFISTATPDEEIADFVRHTVPLLPEGPGVTLLAPAVHAPFPRELVWRNEKLIRIVETERWARGEEPDLSSKDLLVYEGPGCFLAASERVTDEPMHEACLAVRRAFRLEPIATRVIAFPERYGQARFGGRTDPVVIGFYRVVGPAESSR